MKIEKMYPNIKATGLKIELNKDDAKHIRNFIDYQVKHRGAIIGAGMPMSDFYNSLKDFCNED